MLEKKTTEEIIDENATSYPDGSVSLHISRENKVWYSKESLMKWLENNTLKPRASCQDCRRQMEAKVKREAFKIVLEELKGEKE